MDSSPLLPRSDPSIGLKPRRRGGWPAGLFLIAVEFAERAAFYGVQGNLITYLTGELGLPTAAAAAGVNAWGGAASLLPLVGALAADSWFGRYRAVVAAGVLYLLGLGMLTVSSMHDHHVERGGAPASRPPPLPPPASRVAAFYGALYLIALAQGLHKPCAQAFGADQFDQLGDGDGGSERHAPRSSFFNWLHFSMSWGYTLSVAALSYVQDNVSWAAGFCASWAMMLVSLSVFLLGTGTYRLEPPGNGKPFFARFTKVPKDATDGGRCMEGACHGNCDQDAKGVLLKLLPIWTTSLVYAVVISQVPTLFTKQSSTMDRRLTPGGLVVPPAALQCFTSLAIIAFLPAYDRLLVPLARRVTKAPSGLTTLQRVGAGMAISCLAMLCAALVEARRLRTARDAGLVNRPDATVPMSLWWVVPQYALIGLADVFAIVGLQEFFYDQVPDALRSVGLALCLGIMGAGSYLSGMLVSVIDWVTRSRGEGWFDDNQNRAHLDYFYWLLAGLSAMEVIVFLHFARGYVYRNKCSAIQGL